VKVCPWGCWGDDDSTRLREYMNLKNSTSPS
jgi:hypothetical protein